MPGCFRRERQPMFGWVSNSANVIVGSEEESMAQFGRSLRGVIVCLVVSSPDLLGVGWHSGFRSPSAGFFKALVEEAALLFPVTRPWFERFA